MALSIQNNIMALMAGNNLAATYNLLGKSINSLSSGLRINSAADDAAGLAVRELMRSDIAVLNQGIRNANDAISMLQTMDGAASVIDEKLIRMKELAEQAATGTYTDAQRTIMNSEFAAMRDEIDRIAAATEFNGVKMIDGSGAGAIPQVLGLDADATGFDSADAFVSAFTQYTSGEALTVSYTDRDGDTGTVSMTVTSSTTISDVMSWINSTPADVRQTLQVVEQDNTMTAGALFTSAFSEYANHELLTLNYTNNDGTTGEVSRTITSDTTIQDVVNWINLGTADTQVLGLVGVQAANSSDAFVSAFTEFQSGDTLTVSWQDHDGAMHVDTSAVTSTMTISEMRAWLGGLTGVDASFVSGSNYIRLTDAAGTGASYFSVSLAGGTSASNGDGIYEASILNAGADATTGVALTATWTSGTGLALADDIAGYSQAAASFGGGGTYEFGLDTIGQDATADLAMTADFSATADAFTLTDDTSGASQIAASWAGGGSYSFSVETEGDDSDGGQVKIHFGTGNDSDEDYYYVDKQDMTSAATGLNITGLSIATQPNAQLALERIDTAIATKDAGRAHFGAMINRLENTVTNLTIQSENISAAESQISDIDVAFEMSKFLNLQIKAQAAVAMLGQANMLPQMAMSLMGG